MASSKERNREPQQQFREVQFRAVKRAFRDPDFRKFVDPVEGRDRVDAITHTLQTATRAEAELQANPNLLNDLGLPHVKPEEVIVMALVHDLWRPINNQHHADTAAASVRGILPDPLPDVLAHHTEFQLAVINGKPDPIPDEGSWHPLGERLKWWDALSFQTKKEYPTKPLRHFMPMVETVYLGAPRTRTQKVIDVFSKRKGPLWHVAK